MVYRTFNVKADAPTVELALANIEIEIQRCHSEGVKVLKVIHGYGSSGVGGEIKKALSRWLLLKKKQHFITDYIKAKNGQRRQSLPNIKKNIPKC